MEMPRKRGRPKILRTELETSEDRKKLQRESKLRQRSNSDLRQEEQQKSTEARRLTRSQFENTQKESEKYVEEAPKKKRYTYGRRKSSNATIVIDDDAPLKPYNYSKVNVETLQMDCWSEELTPEQKEYYDKVEQEYKEVIEKFEALSKQNGGEAVYKGDTCVAFQYTENITPPTPPPATTTAASTVMIQSKSATTTASTYQLVMDPRLGMIVGTITPAPTAVVTTGNTTSTPTVATVSPQIRVPPKKSSRGRSITSSSNTTVLSNPPPLQPVMPYTVQPQASTSTTSTNVALRPTESTAAGGLAIGSKPYKILQQQSSIVDLTSDDGRPPADSREVAFNKLQGKTFPSLVVVARPHLHAKEASIANDRNALDLKVKSVLIHTPTKFTEWLIQQGLVRSEQTCVVHPMNKLNLGMYSDVSKFPCSGGYVWISSECCPHRFVSVFSGSLFEGAGHTPSVLLKLIYHWSCQTNIQNIVQWVKVDNLYAKGLFTWLRAVCTFALQQHLKPLGGAGKKIEVGVISLGTTSQDGSQRQVKVEVLGVLDPESRLVRLRAVEPLSDGERNYRRRFSKILEPLRTWVNTESIISTDMTVDKGTLHLMGFGNVIQNTASNIASNQTVMEYLRKIVPRMFQNTLSLLSRQIIQQFLDELVWREWFGQTAGQAFNNIVQHLAEQTRMNTTETLIQRLNKIAANPFKNHWVVYQPVTTPKVDGKIQSMIKHYGRKRAAPMPSSAIIDLDRPKKPAMSVAPSLTGDLQEYTKKDTEQQVPLESYYYGTMHGDMGNPLAMSVVLNLKCCVCKIRFTNNIQLLDHLLAHAHNISSKTNVKQCRYCLAILITADELNSHITELHPIETKAIGIPNYACIICETRFSNASILGKHVSNIHVPQEMPYICGTCGFRSSSHRLLVDHFYSTHDGATTLQCPFCLKTMAIWSSGGRVMTASVTLFFNHLQKHQKKRTARKCSKCSLWFCQKDILREHQTKAHFSLVGKKAIKNWALPSNYLMVPRSKFVKENIVEIPPPFPNNYDLILDLSVNVKCRECFKIVKNVDHFPQKFSCNSCQYSTNCIHANQLHKAKCRKLSNSPAPRLKLDAELHCICGYSSDDGNQIAKHLALCERKTAYPTAEQAQAATVPHSMLDVLGLVRRNDDTQQNSSDVEPEVSDKAEPTADTAEVEVIDDVIDEDITKLEPKIELNDTEITTIDD